MGTFVEKKGEDHRPGKIVALINQKGGVGKTTSTVNLAACLALADRKILVLDFDPQGNASSALGIDREMASSKPTIYNALIGESKMSETIHATEVDGLFVSPANSDLTGAEIELVSSFARESKLKTSIAEVRSQYDYILIDCPPSLGLLTVNALTAADSFLVPLQCEYFALEGLSQLLNTIGLIRQSTNPTLAEEGILLTMYDSKTNLSNQVVDEVRKHFANQVFKTVIPRNVRLAECSSFGKPIVLYDVNSKGSVAYLSLANEFLARNQIDSVEEVLDSAQNTAQHDVSESLVADIVQPLAENRVDLISPGLVTPPPFYVADTNEQKL